MRLCQFYTTAEAREADLNRRVPVAARLGLLAEGKVVDITDAASRHHDISSPEYLGVLTACVAAGDEWGAFRKELAGVSSAGGLPPESIFFGPCETH